MKISSIRMQNTLSRREPSDLRRRNNRVQQTNPAGMSRNVRFKNNKNNKK